MAEQGCNQIECTTEFLQISTTPCCPFSDTAIFGGRRQRSNWTTVETLTGNGGLPAIAPPTQPPTPILPLQSSLDGKKRRLTPEGRWEVVGIQPYATNYSQFYGWIA